MNCEKCNAELSENAAVCPQCGEPQMSPKSRTTYVILACLLGAFGVHNFYAGRTLPAVIQLVMTLITCGSGSVIVFFWVLFDIFFTKTDGDRRPMKPIPLLLLILPPAAVILAVVTAVVLILAAILVPALGAARARSQSATCFSNLRQIGTCVMMYANDNRDWMPDRQKLEDGEYLVDTVVYRCPSSEEDYVFLGAGTRMVDSGWGSIISMPPIVIERRGHNGRINVLFMDGHVGSVRLPRDNMSTREIVEFLLDEAEKGIPSYEKNNPRYQQLRAKWLEDAAKY